MEQPEQVQCSHPEACHAKLQSLQGIPTGYDGDEPSHLTEGKEIGDPVSEIERDVVLTHATTRDASFTKDKEAARSVSRKKLEQLLKSTHKTLMLSVQSFKDKKISYKNFSDEFKETLKGAYYKAYTLGLQSTGAAAALTAGGNPLLLPADKKWLEAAFRQELQYLNRFLSDIKRGHQAGRWPHRVGMYVATVGSIYYAGRVAATPANHALFWIAKLDHKICPQCKYMATHSPFTKHNIPITPASGYTRCLANCRCKIVLRPVSEEYYLKLRQGVSRETHLRRLKKAN